MITGIFDNEFRPGGIPASDWLRWRTEDPQTTWELAQEVLATEHPDASARLSAPEQDSGSEVSWRADVEHKRAYVNALLERYIRDDGPNSPRARRLIETLATLAADSKLVINDELTLNPGVPEVTPPGIPVQVSPFVIDATFEVA